MISEETKEKLIDQIRDLTQINFDVNYRFIIGDSLGCVDLSDKIITINPKYHHTTDTFLSLVLHEVGHLYAKDNDIYSHYHDQRPWLTRSHHSKKKWIKTALRAEYWVDKKASVWFKIIRPNGSYRWSYHPQFNKLGRIKFKELLNMAERINDIKLSIDVRHKEIPTSPIREIPISLLQDRNRS
jgi:hypothetical protein